MRVKELMTPNPVTVPPDLELRETVDLMADAHISGLPVVSRGRVVGVVSAADVLAFQASTPAVPTEQPDRERDELSPQEPTDEWREANEAVPAFFTDLWDDAGADVVNRFATTGPEWDVLAEHTVAEVMTRNLLVATPDESVTEAAAAMQAAHVHRLLVMEHQRLLGILTTADIVRAVAEGKLH